MVKFEVNFSAFLLYEKIARDLKSRNSKNNKIIIG